MVTHIPPPSPNFSSISQSSGPRAITQSAVGVAGHPSSAPRSQTRSRSAHPPTLPQSAFPPSPPSSHANSQVTESEYAETVVPPRYRRPPSVTSRASTSAARQHGRHRSASSSSRVDASQQTTNAFPWFAQTGDVEIHIRDRTGRRREKKYLLHSLILAQNSGFFASEFGDAAVGGGMSASALSAGPNSGNTPAMLGGSTFELLAGSRSRSGSVSSASGSKRRWKYELDWGGRSSGQGTGDDAVPILVQSDTNPLALTQPPPVQNKPYHSSFRNLSVSHISTMTSSGSSSTQRDDDMITAYDNLFRAIYNHTPRLDTNNLATAYVECKVLLSLASLYSALPTAGARVDHHLLRFQGRLWRQIAKYPTSYLKLGYLARSRDIFTEAMIHVVGAWPTHENQLRRGQIDDSLLDLVLDKVDELEDARSKVESRLFRLTLTTSRGERVTPTNAWTDWLAVSLFRQYLAENTTPAPVPILREKTSQGQRPSSTSSGDLVFRVLSRGGDGYLTHEELKRFVKLARPDGHLSRDTLRRFERRVDELKNIARDTVKPLTRNFLELDEARVEELTYLSCTRLVDRDYELVWGDPVRN